MRKLLLLLSVVIGLACNSQAQEPKVYSAIGLWNALLVQKNIGEKFYIHNELRYRLIESPNNLQQYLIRPSLHFGPYKWLELSMGYTFAKNNDYRETSGFKKYEWEHNLWKQLVIKATKANWDVKTRLRFETRFRNAVYEGPSINWPTTSKYLQNNRFRIALETGYSFKTYRISIYNEMFLITDSKNTLFTHQNWVGANFSHNFNDNISGYLGLMHQYLAPTNTEHEQNLLIRIGLKLKL